MSSQCYRRHHQQGMALILIAFIVGLGASAMMYKMFNASSLQDQQDEKTMQVLSEAKSALIAWAVSHPNSPGQMPWPDRNTDTDYDPPSAYDGKSDCVTTGFSNSHLLGQLPWKGQSNPCVLPHTGLGREFLDAQGNHLWYAVSRNLVRDYENSENPVINPGLANGPFTSPPYLRQSGTTPYKWLKVLDRNGNLVSDRVAAVIIAPGYPFDDQDRSNPAPNAREFLDKFEIGAVTYSNRTYASADDEDFIMGDDVGGVSGNDATYVRPYYFNDKLVYITIDELMYALEKRVGEQVRSTLSEYQAVKGYYPYAAVLGGLGASRKYRCVVNNLEGSLPVDSSFDTCSYEATANSVSTSCSFQDIASVQFRRSVSVNFTSNTLGCTRSGRTCTCTGAGSCSESANTFACDALGNCISTTMTGRIRFLGAGLDTSTSGTCSLGAVSTCKSRTVTCNGSSPTVTLGYSCSEVINTLPTWFSQNRWQDTLYYQLTRPTNLVGVSLGAKKSGAIVATAGPIISGQTRPSCAVSDYLDGNENTDFDMTYEATNKQMTKDYNDQTFVVAP